MLNLIETKYGKVFCQQNINVEFPTVDGKEICLITIKKGEEPIYTNVSDKHGQKSEKFYVRRGNATVEIEKPSEINEYIRKRFKEYLSFG